MTTLPAGLPAWSRTASIESYGGHADKINFMGQGAIDARTDVTAAQINRLAADMSAIVRVLPLAVIIVQNDDTGVNDPTVLGAWLQSGVSAAGYAGASPPSGFPTATRISDGSVAIQFPVPLTDDFGVEQKVHIRAAEASVSGDVADVSWGAPTDPDADGYYERIVMTAQDDSGVVIDTLMRIEIY